VAAETKVKSFSPVPLSFYDLPSGFQVPGSWSVTDHDTKFRVTFRVSRHGTQIRDAAQRSGAKRAQLFASASPIGYVAFSDIPSELFPIPKSQY